MRIWFGNYCKGRSFRLESSVIQTSTADARAAGRAAPGRDEDTSPHTPILIVAPAVDGQYRADYTLSETHAKTLQARTLARLVTYADGYDIPVLVTRGQCDDFTAPVATAITEED
jgi:hypothetical protein